MNTLKKIIVLSQCLLLWSQLGKGQAIVPAENFIPGEVKLLKNKNEKIYLIYGVPTTVNSTPSEKIVVSVRTATTAWKNYPPVFVIKGSKILDIAELNGRIYLCGDFGFSETKLKTNNCLAEFIPKENAWHAPIGFTGNNSQKPVVKSIAASNGQLYIGGDFSTAKNNLGKIITVNNFFKFDTIKTVMPFAKGNIGANGYISEIATDATGNLFVGGAFTKIADKAQKNIFYFNTKDSMFDGVGQTFKEVLNVKFINGNLIVHNKGDDTTIKTVINIRNTNNIWSAYKINDSLLEIKNVWILDQTLFMNCISTNKGRYAGLYKVNTPQKLVFRFLEQLNKVEYAEMLNSNEIYLAGNLVPAIFNSIGNESINFGKLLMNSTRFTGRFYLDANNDGAYTQGEPFLPNFQIKVVNRKMNLVLNSDKNGFVSAVLPIISDSTFISLLNSEIASISKFKGFRTDTLFNKLYLIGVNFKRGNKFEDIKTNITSFSAYNGLRDKQNSYIIKVENNGLTKQKVNLVFNYPKNIQTPFFSVQPSRLTPGQAIWDTIALNNFSSKSILFSGKLNANNFATNQEISFTSSALPAATTDDLPLNNSDSLSQLVVNTNNLIAKFQNVKPSTVDNISYLNAADGKIDYTIRFSNPTSDTINTVTVSDTIAIPDYVTYSQEIGSSHPFSRTIYTTPSLPDKLIMVYTFSDINLHPNLTGNYENTNAVGYISIRVGFDPKKVAAGNKFENRASIYLDNYSPILTNMVSAVVDKTAKLKNIKDSEIKLYPNPTHNLLNIASPNFPINSLEIYNVSGQKLSEIQMNSAENTKFVDVSNLSSGIYFVRLMSGNQTFVQRFIKE